MPIRTKRWNDPVEADDGFRVLVSRYRPRGLRRGRETWDAWARQLAPSVALHAAFYGKRGPPIAFDEYRTRFLDEMSSQRGTLLNLAGRIRGGQTITLLCSSACKNPARCHRTLLKALIDAELPAELQTPPDARAPAVPDKFTRLRDWLR